MWSRSDFREIFSAINYSVSCYNGKQEVKYFIGHRGKMVSMYRCVFFAESNARFQIWSLIVFLYLRFVIKNDSPGQELTYSDVGWIPYQHRTLWCQDPEMLSTSVQLTQSQWCGMFVSHYSDVIISTMASQITSLTVVYSAVYSGEDQRKHQSSASLAFVRGIHRWPVNSPHKGPVTRKMFPFEDAIMFFICLNRPFNKQLSFCWLWRH